MKTVHTFVNFAKSSTSVTISITGLGLSILPISSEIACGLNLVEKVFHEKF